MSDDRLRDEITGLADHLEAIAKSYLDEAPYWHDKGHTGMHNFSLGKAQAYRVAADKIRELLTPSG